MITLVVIVILVLVVVVNIIQILYNHMFLQRLLKDTRPSERLREGLDRGLIVVSPCRASKMSREDLGNFMRTLREFSRISDNIKILIVVDNEIEREILRRDLAISSIEILISSESVCKYCSKKIRAILTALESLRDVREENSILILIDCDAYFKNLNICVHSLVETLARHENSLISGYRWYLLDSFCGSLYNLISSLYFESVSFQRTRIVWGGFMSSFKFLIDRYSVVRELSDEIADDAAMRRVFVRNRARVVFNPYCIGFTEVSCERDWFRRFIEWSTRQLLMIRIYTPKGFYHVLAGYLIIALSMLSPLYVFFFGSLGETLISLFLSLTLYVSGVMKSIILTSFISKIHGARHAYGKLRYLAVYSLLTGVRVFIALPLLIKTIFIKSFKWRDTTYCIISENKRIKAVPC